MRVPHQCPAFAPPVCVGAVVLMEMSVQLVLKGLPEQYIDAPGEAVEVVPREYVIAVVCDDDVVAPAQSVHRTPPHTRSML